MDGRLMASPADLPLLWQSVKHGGTRTAPLAMMMRRSVGHTVGSFNSELDDDIATIEYLARASQSGASMGIITEALFFSSAILSHDSMRTLTAAQVSELDVLIESVDLRISTLDHTILPSFPRAFNTSHAANVLDKKNTRVLMLLPWLHIGGADV